MAPVTARAAPAPGAWGGIAIMVATTVLFAVQDAVSRHLAGEYNTFMVVMVRYWFLAAFVLAVARRSGGLRAAARTRRPWLQAARGALLIADICLLVQAFTLLGLVESHALFAVYPLLVAALSGPVLGEQVGPWRLGAIAAGLVGVGIMLRPGSAVLSPVAALPLAAALCFAAYSVLTRLAAREDAPATSLLWMGLVGAALTTALGLPAWEPLRPEDWGWMALLCVLGVSGHGLLIVAYDRAEASALQPFTYLQAVWAGALGILLFGEALAPPVALGAAVVIAAGLVALLRERRAARRAPRP